MKKADATEIALALKLSGAADAHVFCDSGNQWEVIYQHCEADPKIAIRSLADLASTFHTKERCSRR